MGNDKRKGHRREFSLDYKRRMVRAADACQRGELAPLLAREGLYGSQITQWRQELGRYAESAAKATPNATRGQARGQAAAKAPVSPFKLEQVPNEAAVDGLERQIADWRRKIELAEKIIEGRKVIGELEAELARG